MATIQLDTYHIVNFKYILTSNGRHLYDFRHFHKSRQNTGYTFESFFFSGFPKSGTCPLSSNSDRLQLGPSCFHDENCHGVQKCCPTINNGNRCQIPVEYQRSGICNENYVYDPSPNPPYFTRRACNHDHTCPYNGKCCRRWSSDQIDTCTYPFLGGSDVPRIPEIPVYPYPPVTRHGPVYPPRGKVY